jgi:hypothetical protein
MGFVFIWYMIRTEIRHRREDAQDARPPRSRPAIRAARPARGIRRTRIRAATPPPREPRPTDRDMAEEDALLDEVSPR